MGQKLTIIFYTYYNKPRITVFNSKAEHCPGEHRSCVEEMTGHLASAELMDANAKLSVQ